MTQFLYPSTLASSKNHGLFFFPIHCSFSTPAVVCVLFHPITRRQHGLSWVEFTIKESLGCKRTWSDGGIFFPLFQQGAYYTQPVYAAQPHVIHHTTVVQPNSIPSAIYPAPVAAPRTNGVAMGMVAGTTMAMSAGKPGPLPVL